MCIAIEHKIKRILFDRPGAALPILKKSGDIGFVTWGRRQIEFGKCPVGGWAPLNTVYAHKWKRYHPTPVVIPATAFQVKDQDGEYQWIQIAEGLALQGLLAHAEDDELRVYVLTVPVLPEYSYADDRWRRVVHL